MNQVVTIVDGEPTVIPIAAMALDYEGIQEMSRWVKQVRPECIDGDVPDNPIEATMSLFPHDGTEDGRTLTDNELLVELAGRKCYDSFGEKAGRKNNSEYIKNTQGGDIPHASIMYHAKMSFFVAGISRRVSHELIRHYVGADRDEEGSPSQESTRYVEHSGRYIQHPGAKTGWSREMFHAAVQANRGHYCEFLENSFNNYFQENGEQARGMSRKRIFEVGSSFLCHSAETSFIWTTNPVALAKLCRERDNEASDLEFQRFAKLWKSIAVAKWPNLFCQPWMQT